MALRAGRYRPIGAGSAAHTAATLAPFYPQGCLVAYARGFEGGALNEHFDLRPVTPSHSADALQALATSPLAEEPAILLFSSYVWNHQANLEVAHAAKQRCPDSLMVFGGPHIPRRSADVEAFFARHPFVDVAARGEGEKTMAGMFSAIAAAGLPERLSSVDLCDVPGLSYRGYDGALRQTADRERTRDLACFPSPYLGGEFAHWIEGLEFAHIETNRGCPYGCSFCDWGAATLSKVHTMSDDRVFGEIEFLAKNGVLGIVICDANFGILPRDLDIAKFIVEMHDTHGYPRDIAYTNAKVARPRFLEIIKLLHDAGLTKAGQISMQTVDTTVLDIAKRTNVKTNEYDRIVRFFHQAGTHATSDMMIGLPGQTFETTKKDLQFFFDRMVTTAMHATTVMPNAPMADPEYMERYEITVDEEAFVESTYSFSKADYQRILALCYAYKFFVKVGAARYLLYFMQREHGVPAMDFLASWLVDEDPLYPISLGVRDKLLSRRYHSSQKHWLMVAWMDQEAAFLFDDTDAFYRELLRFYAERFGIRAEGADLESVLAAQRAVLPDKARALPDSVALEHDFVGYFHALRRGGGVAASFEEVPPLRAWGPGVVVLPQQPRPASYDHVDDDPVVGSFELYSSLSAGFDGAAGLVA